MLAPHYACGRNGLYVQEVREPATITGSSENPMRTGVPYKMVVLAVKTLTDG